jgi:hypothetical protein
MQRLREYRSVCKIIEEGYNWKDQREYVLKRLAVLGEGAYLSSFDWNAGGVLHDRGVSVQTPTDPDIIMHVFLMHLDSFAEHRRFDGDQPFILQFFLPVRAFDLHPRHCLKKACKLSRTPISQGASKLSHQ